MTEAKEVPLTVGSGGPKIGKATVEFRDGDIVVTNVEVTDQRYLNMLSSDLLISLPKDPVDKFREECVDQIYPRDTLVDKYEINPCVINGCDRPTWCVDGCFHRTKGGLDAP